MKQTEKVSDRDHSLELRLLGVIHPTPEYIWAEVLEYEWTDLVRPSHVHWVLCQIEPNGDTRALWKPGGLWAESEDDLDSTDEVPALTVSEMVGALSLAHISLEVPRGSTPARSLADSLVRSIRSGDLSVHAVNAFLAE